MFFLFRQKKGAIFHHVGETISLFECEDAHRKHKTLPSPRSQRLVNGLKMYSQHRAMFFCSVLKPFVFSTAQSHIYFPKKTNRIFQRTHTHTLSLLSSIRLFGRGGSVCGVSHLCRSAGVFQPEYGHFTSPLAAKKR